MLGDGIPQKSLIRTTIGFLSLDMIKYKKDDPEQLEDVDEAIWSIRTQLLAIKTIQVNDGKSWFHIKDVLTTTTVYPNFLAESIQIFCKNVETDEECIIDINSIKEYKASTDSDKEKLKQLINELNGLKYIDDQKLN
jgi:hypothetical protein